MRLVFHPDDSGFGEFCCYLLSTDSPESGDSLCGHDAFAVTGDGTGKQPLRGTGLVGVVLQGVVLIPPAKASRK